MIGDGVSGSAVIETRPAKRAVERHRQVDLAVEQLVQNDRCHHATTGCKVGVHEDLRHRRSVGKRAHRELRAAVEAEPAEPQDERAERGERHA